MAANVRRLPVDKSLPHPQRDALRVSELTKQVSAWFQKTVREEEPSADYANYLSGLIEVEWRILAEELLADAWGEGP